MAVAVLAGIYPGHITDIPNGIRLNGGEYQTHPKSRWNADKWQELKIQLGKNVCVCVFVC